MCAGDPHVYVSVISATLLMPTRVPLVDGKRGDAVNGPDSHWLWISSEQRRIIRAAALAYVTVTITVHFHLLVRFRKHFVPNNLPVIVDVDLGGAEFGACGDRTGCRPSVTPDRHDHICLFLGRDRHQWIRAREAPN